MVIIIVFYEKFFFLKCEFLVVREEKVVFYLFWGRVVGFGGKSGVDIVVSVVFFFCCLLVALFGVSYFIFTGRGLVNFKVWIIKLCFC